MADPEAPQPEWRWRLTRSEKEVDDLQLWQRDVISEISSLKTDLSTIKDWFKAGTVAMIGMMGTIVVWLLTGHHP